MRSVKLTIPRLALIAGTRGALGAGLALLTSDRLDPRVRRRIGLTLLAIGALSTLPLGFDVLTRLESARG